MMQFDTLNQKPYFHPGSLSYLNKKFDLKKEMGLSIASSRVEGDIKNDYTEDTEEPESEEIDDTPKIPSKRIAIEYQGHGTFQGRHVGRHASAIGMTGDCEKFNQAALHGWHVIKFTALHFSETQRQKHKLESPYQLLTKLLQ